jgi:hypothetical protein
MKVFFVVCAVIVTVLIDLFIGYLWGGLHIGTYVVLLLPCGYLGTFLTREIFKYFDAYEAE